jgi:hypothetical protein
MQEEAKCLPLTNENPLRKVHFRNSSRFTVLYHRLKLLLPCDLVATPKTSIVFSKENHAGIPKQRADLLGQDPAEHGKGGFKEAKISTNMK